MFRMLPSAGLNVCEDYLDLFKTSLFYSIASEPESQNDEDALNSPCSTVSSSRKSKRVIQRSDSRRRIKVESGIEGLFFL